MHIRDPFPHVIVENFYSREELSLIKVELKQLSSQSSLLIPGTHHGMSGQTTSRAVALEDHCFRNSKSSDILRIFTQKLSEGFVNGIVENFPQFTKLRYINKIYTKVRYYHNNEGYDPHIDIHQDFLAFSYFHSYPKKFSGGELNFPEYNYKFGCADNTFILIPGYVKHGVLTVKIENDDYWNGNGRYCVSQFLNTIPTAKF